jgi:hypothetical protein
MHNDECPEPLILRFYLAKDGSLVCRATESATNRSWFIRRPAALKALLYPTDQPTAHSESSSATSKEIHP